MAIPYNKNEKYGCKEAYKHKAQSAETEDRWERARIKKDKQGNEPTIAEKKAEKGDQKIAKSGFDGPFPVSFRIRCIQYRSPPFHLPYLRWRWGCSQFLR